MKQILMITVVLSVITFAIIGCMFIFELMSYEDAMSNLLKVVGGIVLFGACSAVISVLMGSKK